MVLLILSGRTLIFLLSPDIRALENSATQCDDKLSKISDYLDMFRKVKKMSFFLKSNSVFLTICLSECINLVKVPTKKQLNKPKIQLECAQGQISQIKTGLEVSRLNITNATSLKI